MKSILSRDEDIIMIFLSYFLPYNNLLRSVNSLIIWFEIRILGATYFLSSSLK